MARTTVGPYRIVGKLGEGGMGEVFRAIDPRLQRPVAIKLLHGDAARAETARQRFEREARAVAALSHPNICVVHDYDIDEAGQPYLVMEYLEGETLQRRLERGPLPLADVISIGAALADALETTHALGIVHRDIKPANVFLTTKNQPKLMDFGIARMASGDSDEAALTGGADDPLTAAGAAIGTVSYMSPEQARGQPIDARTDIFSLGVTLFEMASGARPFAGGTAPLIYDAILNREPPRLRTLRPDLPLALDAAIAETLVKDRDRRLPSAQALRDRLLAIPATRERTAAGTGARAEALGVAAGRRRMLAAAAAIVVLGAAAAGITLWRTNRAGAAAGVRTLAVLPFDASAARDAREAMQGLAAAIADTLARHPELTVIAGQRTAAFAASSEPVDAIARSLGADAALQTSVAQSGDQLQVAAALVGTGGERLWAETYARPRAELFAVQQALAGDLVRVLNLAASPAAANATAVAAGSVDPRAYDLYLRGRYHSGRWNEPELDTAIGLLEQATAIDPAFASAQAMLGMFYGVKAFNYRPNDPQWRSKGHAAIGKALALDPESAEAHYARGILIWQPSEAWPHRAALDEFRRALARQPNLDDAWHHRGVVLMHIGHLARADGFYERAVALNPVNTQAQFRFAPLRNYQQRYDDALAVLRRVPREIYPSQWTYHMGWSLVTLGRLREAAEEIASALAGNSVDQGGVIHATRALLRAKSGDRRGAEADVATAIAVGRGFGHFHHTALTIGEVYAQLGDLDRAQEWVERAADDGFPCYAFFEVDPHLAPLRATDRFRQYLARLRAEWEHVGAEDDDPPRQ